MSRLFRSSSPGFADYLSLAIAAVVFLAIAGLLLAPGGSFISAQPGQISRALP